MGSRTPGHGVAIFGRGKIGTALHLESGCNVPLYSRGESIPVGSVSLAIVCWPAQELEGFTAHFPTMSAVERLSFSNGVWAGEGGMYEGICYVHAATIGTVASPSKNGWRVSQRGHAARLRSLGVGITLSSPGTHRSFVWGKALCLLPFALAGSPGMSAKRVAQTEGYKHWFEVVRSRAVSEVGEELFAPQLKRALWIAGSRPSKHTMSLDPAEVAYFRSKLDQGTSV